MPMICNWKSVNDLIKLDEYYKSWRLRGNPSKTHLSNIYPNQTSEFSDELISFTKFPNYLEGTLVRSLTFK